MSFADYRAWYSRARSKIDLRDLLWLLPPGIAAIVGMHIAQKLTARPEEQPRCDDLTARDPELHGLVMELFRLIGRDYFRLEVLGAEQLPAAGPLMLAGSHNGGSMPLDALFTLLAVHERFDGRRIVHTLAHETVFTHPVARRYALGLGILKAGHGAGEKVVDAGRMLLVYPGSDWDSCRSFAERDRIDLHGRTGFLRFALRHRVPIAPVVSTGTHEQLVILARGDGLARALRLHKLLRTDVFPIVLALPWGLTSGFLPYLPLPAQTTISFGAPIAFPEVDPAQAEDPSVLARCYGVVQARMQAMLDELSAGRVPLLGKPGNKKPAP
jgi:1-acyl-sn-glycerol-3-phosphate acyltransferase